MNVEIGSLVAVTKFERSGLRTLCRRASGFGDRPVLQRALGFDGGRQAKLLLDHSRCRCGPLKIRRKRKATAEYRYLSLFPAEIGFNRFHGEL
jgi:hypothetical protein